MAPYDLVGNIVIVKFSEEDKNSYKKKWAREFMRKNKQVKTVLEKVGKFKGRLRVQKTEYVFGEKTKEALYKENGCEFRFNVGTCYFSPRLASERKEIASFVDKNEKVLVMFGGVAPFAIVIAKLSKPKKVVNIEISRECNKYARENVKRNKVEKIVELIQGDVKKKLPNEKFDRIVMARPNLEETFLPFALKAAKKNCIIHYYGFCKEDEVEAMKFMLLKQAEEENHQVKILNVKKAGDIGPFSFRYRIDLRVVK